MNSHQLYLAGRIDHEIRSLEAPVTEIPLEDMLEPGRIILIEHLPSSTGGDGGGLPPSDPPPDPPREHGRRWDGERPTPWWIRAIVFCLLMIVCFALGQVVGRGAQLLEEKLVDRWAR